VALLLEPWNRRHASRSFLRDLQAGQAGPLARTLLAGLLCGLLWELWNFWARAKWIYTVPGLGGLKLFEMPLLGFFGFPPFTVECLVVVRFLSAVWTRGIRHGRTARRLVAAGLGLAAAVLTLVIFRAADAVTVESFYVPVERLDVLSPLSRERLAGAGLGRPDDVLKALASVADRKDWAQRTGLSVAELSDAHARVRLVTHRGIGGERALALERLGIRTRADLAGWDAGRLAAALRASAGGTPRDRFLERRVGVWLRGSAVGTEDR